MSSFAKALAADLQSGLQKSEARGCPVKGRHMSALHRDACSHCNPKSAGNPSMSISLQYARLLNEARILLQHFDADQSFGSEIGDFERRCCEQVGLIVEPLSTTTNLIEGA